MHHTPLAIECEKGMSAIVRREGTATRVVPGLGFGV